jgi:outer membrane protein TolC
MGKLTRDQISCCIALLLSGCAAPAWKPSAFPAVAPASQPSAQLDLDSAQIEPMYRDLVRVDLPTVVQVASARNIEIEQARQRVAASRGRYDSSVEALLPVIAPAIAYQKVWGVNQAANGTLTPVNADTFLPAISVQWILNPGRVAYDIVASRRRLEASQQTEQAVLQETIRQAVIEYYDLALAQSRLAAARQAVAQAEELLRITQLRVHAGTGLSADEVRAQASLAEYQQDLALAINGFFQASVTLTLTLDLDPAMTLVPQPKQMGQMALVREDISIDELLATALQHRSDLEAVRTLVRAAEADSHAIGWGGFGPQVSAGYSYGGIAADAGTQTFSMHEQQKAGAGAAVNLDFSTLGRLKTADASQRLATLDTQRQLDRVRAAVVTAQQAGITQAKVVPAAHQQLQSAEEALRLAQANLQAGTMLTIDVLQAQRAVDDARLRYAEAVVRYNQSQVNLLAAMGVLDEHSLLLGAQTASPSTAPALE